MTKAVQSAERFFAAVFEPTDIIEIRMFPSKRRAWADSYFKVIDQWGEIEAAADQNVYFGANPRTGHGGKAEDVAMARCVFVDIDDEVNEKAVEKRVRDAGLPEPTAVVFSGHGFQVWWRLAEPMTDIAAWSVVQRRLIAALGSDPSIHDAPRVMRMPGTMNVKRTPHVVAELRYAADAGTGRVRLEDIESVLPPPMSKGVESATLHERGLLSGEKRPLAYATLEFIAHGAAEGERNARLFRAACDLCGCGYSVDEAWDRLGRAAASCGLEPDEIGSTIESAYGQPRTPAKPPEVDMPPGWSAVPDGMVAGTGPATSGAIEPVGRAAEESVLVRYGSDWILETSGEKALLANCIHMRGGGDEEKSWHRHVPAERLASDLYEMTGGWPRVAGGQLFVPSRKPRDGELPEASSVHYIASVDDLFAWINHVADVHWVRKEVRSANKSARTALTKGELMAYVTQHPFRGYASVELLPHEPMVEGLWYAPCRLPDDGFEALASIVGRLNAETDIDRVLMLAALLTGGWGGAPGARPAMLYTSTHGRGVGKTSTAMIAANIWGLSIQLNPKDDWDKAMGRMLSEQAMAGRAVLIDNIKGRLDLDKLDALLTSPVIEGHRMYVGHTTRPNRLLTLITANDPRLSADLAARSVVIRVGASKWQDAGFASWIADHIETRRASIVSACLRILRDAAGLQGRLPLASESNRDRWARWQDGPLAAASWACGSLAPFRSLFQGEVPTIDQVASEVARRRGGVDDDVASAHDVADEIVAAIVAAGRKPNDSVHIPAAAMVAILHGAELIGSDMGPRQGGGWISGLVGNGLLKSLKKSRPKTLGGRESRQNVRRGWRWSPDGSPVKWILEKPGFCMPLAVVEEGGNDQESCSGGFNEETEQDSDDGLPI